MHELTYNKDKTIIGIISLRRRDVEGLDMILYYKNKDRITTKIEVDYRTGTVRIENYSDFPLELAFGINKHPTIQDFEDFLESRCFPRTRDRLKLHLRELGLDYYDPYAICKKTHGCLEGDPYSIEFV